MRFPQRHTWVWGYWAWVANGVGDGVTEDTMGHTMTLYVDVLVYICFMT